MRALVVYESMFGNTKAVAEAIAAGIERHLEVTVLDVSAAPTSLPDDVGLVVAGGPTHMFGMSRRSTREAAGQQIDSTVTPISAGLREWLDALSRSSTPVDTAAFDTRVKRRGLPGSAARKAERRLGRLGFRRAARAESFWVADSPGPLVDGERTRAQDWGSDLASHSLRQSRAVVSDDASALEYEHAMLIALGSGVGVVVGVLVGGGASIALGAAFGAAGGVILGAIRNSMPHRSSRVRAP